MFILFLTILWFGWQFFWLGLAWLWRDHTGGRIHVCQILGQLKWLGQLGLVDMVAEVFSEAKESKSNIQALFKLLLVPPLVMSHWLEHVL